MKDVYTAFEKPEYFWNRELSWIRFDERILEEAQDTTIPLFERMKFLSITSSNLDEFYMVRVASLKDQVHTGYAKRDIAGMTPKEQLAAISEANHKLVADQYKTFRDSLIPALAVAGLRIYKCHEELSDAQKSYIDAYFDSNVYPVLTPMAMDSSRPFPLIRNKSLNIGALIKKKGSDDQRTSFATVQVPSVLPRFIELPETEEGITSMILMDEIIERNLEKLFLGYEVVCAHPYRIMRNAELGIDEEEAADLLVEIQKSLRKRQWGEVIRLEVEEGIESELLRILKEEFYVREDDIFYINGPLDLTFLMKLYGTKGFDDYKEPSYTPAEVPELQNDDDIFANIRKGDIFLHHPYMSFSPVVDFVRTAATDPNVLAIKQTLYRVSGNSPIIAALAQAAENGKQVTALVELKARFDEENNIVWAQKLEKAGCHVIYGLVGLKTHSKITLVVRKEEDGIRRYVHLGTGNYNDSTAKLYTDCGILTCDERIGEDASAAFNMISGYSEPDRWNSLLVAPIWMRERFLHLIRMEQKHAEEGRKALIVAKMNSLCDREIIAALYKASAAGVKISLIVRGICCLKTGIPGISDNITVRSLVGNFLEHARIFYFYANGAEEVYMGSADWMPRNLDKRVEIVFPLTDQHCKDEAIRILQIQLSDNIKARTLQSDGSYIKLPPQSDMRICAQDYFCEYAQKKAKEKEEAEDKRVFIPAEPVNE
ncbi:MAG: RNA degradosome polyphosphate kinase [Eubacterium sp.]|nr:RNA degradosome polyphosphate kinase [Eubacterium sp.]